MTQYLRKHFTYEYNSRGYMLKYKGQNIGGGSILHSVRGPIGPQAIKQAKEYRGHAETAIQNILVGNPGRIYREAIEEIDEVIEDGTSRDNQCPGITQKRIFRNRI